MTIRRNPECEASIGVVHVTFGTAHFTQSLFRLRRSARRFGIDDMRVYHRAHPAVRRATEENRQIFWQPRGAGYWLWKPYILLWTPSTRYRKAQSSSIPMPGIGISVIHSPLSPQPQHEI